MKLDKRASSERNLPEDTNVCVAVFQKPAAAGEMFVRNSAGRGSLSERMKGLGRDVRKKIAARLKSRGSKDAEEVRLTCCPARVFRLSFIFSRNSPRALTDLQRKHGRSIVKNNCIF